MVHWSSESYRQIPLINKKHTFFFFFLSRKARNEIEKDG